MLAKRRADLVRRREMPNAAQKRPAPPEIASSGNAFQRRQDGRVVSWLDRPQVEEHVAVFHASDDGRSPLAQAAQEFIGAVVLAANGERSRRQS